MSVLLVLAVSILLVLAGARWGADTRDGRDWQTRAAC
jgi:hypothetical protein